MKALVDRWLADDLAAFDGLTLSASLPVKEQILNDVLALLIQPDAPASAAGESDAPAPSAPQQPAAPTPRLDPRKFIRRAEVSAEGGRLTLHCDVYVGDPPPADAALDTAHSPVEPGTP